MDKSVEGLDLKKQLAARNTKLAASKISSPNLKQSLEAMTRSYSVMLSELDSAHAATRREKSVIRDLAKKSVPFTHG